MEIRRLNRKILDHYNTILMVVTLSLVLLTPVVMLVILGYKSSTLLHEQSILKILFTSAWEPNKGE